MAMVDYKTDTLSVGGGGGGGSSSRPSNPISVPNGQGGYTRPRPNQSNSGNGFRCDRNNDGDCWDEASHVLNGGGALGTIAGGACLIPGGQAVAGGLAIGVGVAWAGATVTSAIDNGYFN